MRKKNYIILKEYRFGFDGTKEVPDILRFIFTNGYTLAISLGDSCCSGVSGYEINPSSLVELKVIRPFDTGYVPLTSHRDVAGYVSVEDTAKFVCKLEMFTDEKEIKHYFDIGKDPDALVSTRG